MLMTLPNYDIASIATPEEGLLHIQKNLVLLKEIATNTDFSVDSQRLNFNNNITFIKQYYERVDILLAMRGDS